MATPKKEKAPETPGYVKTTELSALFDATPRWIQDLTKQRILKKYNMPAGERYNLIESIKAYIKYLRDKATGREERAASADKEDQKLTQEIKLKKAKARMAELELNEFEGKMHRSEDVEALTTDLILFIRGMIMSLPGQLAVDMAQAETAPEAAERMKQAVYSILKEISNYRYDPKEYQKRVKERQGWPGDETDEEGAE